MKSQNINVAELATIIATALAAALGTPIEQVETPKTSAKLRTRDANPAMATKRPVKRIEIEDEDETDEDTIEINCPHDRADNRIRVPARAFGANGVCFIDGTKFVAMESDAGRSTKMQPSVFDAEAGDTIFLTRVGKNKWDSEVQSAPKSRKAKPVAAPKMSPSKAKPVAAKTAAKVVPAKVVRTEKQTGNLSQEVKRFAALALENAGNDVVNQHIVDAGTFETDARMYLTTKENKQFRAIWKNAGLTLGKAVRMLNAQVYE